MTPPPLTPDEAARRLGLDKVAKHPERVILDMARRGDLRRIRVGRYTMIDAESVERILQGEA